MNRNAKVRQGDGKAVGKAKAEQDDEAMDVLSKTNQRTLVEAIAAVRGGADTVHCLR